MGDAPQNKRKMGGEARSERKWGREVNAPQKKEGNVRKLRPKRDWKVQRENGERMETRKKEKRWRDEGR